MTKALEGGETEVQLGQLAQQKSESADVKQFAQKISDHSQMADVSCCAAVGCLGTERPFEERQEGNRQAARTLRVRIVNTSR